MTKNKNKSKSNNRKSKTKPRVVIKEVVRPMSVGAQLGDSLQKLAVSTFKRVTGMGDYKLSPNITQLQSNSMMSKFAPQAPKFGSTASSFVFEHCEYLGDINGSSGLQVASYNINPLDPTTFPWLSQVAGSFESYQIEGMLVRFESTSGQATGTNTAVGTVMSYIAYDVMDPLPTSKQIILQYDGVVDAKASDNFLVGVECDTDRLVMKRLYVGFPSSEGDARFNTFGKIIVANQGQQGTNQIGEMWLHYRVRFYVAKDAGLSTGIDPPYTAFGSSLVASPNLTPFFGTVLTGSPTIQLTFSNTQMQFIGSPGGLYQIYLGYSGGSVSAALPEFIFGNCSLIDYPAADASMAFGWGGTAARVGISFLVLVDSNVQPGQQSTVTLTTATGTFPTNPLMAGFMAKIY